MATRTSSKDITWYYLNDMVVIPSCSGSELSCKCIVFNRTGMTAMEVERDSWVPYGTHAHSSGRSRGGARGGGRAPPLILTQGLDPPLHSLVIAYPFTTFPFALFSQSNCPPFSWFPTSPSVVCRFSPAISLIVSNLRIDQFTSSPVQKVAEFLLKMTSFFLFLIWWLNSITVGKSSIVSRL